MAHPLKAVILAGGRSARMGTDKALLQLKGKPLIAHISDTLRTAFESTQLYIAGTNPHYAFLQHPMIPDLWPHKGPCGGIVSALQYCQNDIFVCPCDMPLLHPAFLRDLWQRASADRVSVLIYRGRMYPTLGRYPFHAATDLTRYLTQGIHKMQDLLRLVRAQPLHYHDSALQNMLANINTPSDYLALNTA